MRFSIDITDPTAPDLLESLIEVCERQGKLPLWGDELSLVCDGPVAQNGAAAP